MQIAAPLTERPTLVVISDLVEGAKPGPDRDYAWQDAPAWIVPWPRVDVVAERARLAVTGSYLERLPLACIKAGLVEQAEIWHHHDDGPGMFCRDNPVLARRSLRVRDRCAPFASDDMLEFIKAFGAPHVLCVLGLGVDRRILQACANSVLVYNSIDAPALRVPAEVSAAFDLVLTGAQWQSDAVAARHPAMQTAIMPIGPEFAAAEMFRPLGAPKMFDVIYVAAAQPYKRHDIMFDALAQLPRSIRALCVFGYGELADELRRSAHERRLNVEFVGPPGVPFTEVNRLMNSARIGVVCGVDDGAPAILTEYMLAGLPVLANAALSCGRQFIVPKTGMLADADGFAGAMMAMLRRLDDFAPREAVLARWTWQHTVRRFGEIIRPILDRKYI